MTKRYVAVDTTYEAFLPQQPGSRFAVTGTAEEFARYVAENKPYLIEIEDEIQKMGKFGEMDIKLSIRGGIVEKVSFWKGRTWLRDKASLTQLPHNDIK